MRGCISGGYPLPVLCPSNTFMATPLAAIHAGARVQFVHPKSAGGVLVELSEGPPRDEESRG